MELLTDAKYKHLYAKFFLLLINTYQGPRMGEEKDKVHLGVFYACLFDPDSGTRK